MREKIENARQQSLQARQRAQSCADDRTRDEWLVVARMWEDLATEYRQVEKLKIRMRAVDG